MSGCYQGPKDACCIRGRGAVAARSSVAPTTRSHGFGLDFGETGAPSRRSQEISASDRRLDQNYGPLPQTLSRSESESLFTRFSSFRHLPTPDIHRKASIDPLPPRWSLSLFLRRRGFCPFCRFRVSQTLSGLALARHPSSPSSSRPNPCMVDRRFG